MATFTTGGVFFENEAPKPHQCNLPTMEKYWPLGFEPAAWQCSECKQVYEITYDAWTGWWSPDMDEDVESGNDQYGRRVIYCRWQTWTECPPNIRFMPRKPNLLNVSAIIVDHPNPGPRPLWLPPLPQPRRPYGDAVEGPLKTFLGVSAKTQEELGPRRTSWVKKVLGREG